MEIFPADTATDLITSVTGAIGDNIVVIMAVLGFFVGLGLVLKLFRRSTHGKL